MDSQSFRGGGMEIDMENVHRMNAQIPGSEVKFCIYDEHNTFCYQPIKNDLFDRVHKGGLKIKLKVD